MGAGGGAVLKVKPDSFQVHKLSVAVCIVCGRRFVLTSTHAMVCVALDKELYPSLPLWEFHSQNSQIVSYRWQALIQLWLGNIKGGRGLAGFSLILVWDFSMPRAGGVKHLPSACVQHLVCLIELNHTRCGSLLVLTWSLQPTAHTTSYLVVSLSVVH